MNNFMRSIALAVAVSSAAMPAQAGIAERAQRVGAGGVDVVTYGMNVPDVVTIAGSLPAGDAAAHDDIAAATLTAMMLSRGTTTQDKLAIAKALDGVGAHLRFSTNADVLRVDAQCLKKDLPLVIRILAQELRNPSFAREELDRAKAQLRARIQQREQITGLRAAEALSRDLFPAGHPEREHTAGEWLEAVDAATVEDLRAFHRSNYGPKQFTLVFAGDTDAAQIHGEMTKAFAGWTGGSKAGRDVGAPSAPAELATTIPMADKASVTVILGQRTGLRYSDSDALALRVGTSILGGGMTSRLMAHVREEEGLTYGIVASVEDDTFTDGSWSVGVDFAPSLLERGLKSTRRLVSEWWESGVTATELESRKATLIGEYQVGLATTTGLAGTVLTTIERGMPLTWLDQYPQAIKMLTVEQVNAAIRKHLDPKNMVLVEAGTL
jgi:zinc protease